MVARLGDIVKDKFGNVLRIIRVRHRDLLYEVVDVNVRNRHPYTKAFDEIVEVIDTSQRPKFEPGDKVLYMTTVNGTETQVVATVYKVRINLSLFQWEYNIDYETAFGKETWCRVPEQKLFCLKECNYPSTKSEAKKVAELGTCVALGFEKGVIENTDLRKDWYTLEELSKIAINSIYGINANKIHDSYKGGYTMDKDTPIASHARIDLGFWEKTQNLLQSLVADNPGYDTRLEERFDPSRVVIEFRCLAIRPARCKMLCFSYDDILESDLGSWRDFIIQHFKNFKEECEIIINADRLFICSGRSSGKTAFTKYMLNAIYGANPSLDAIQDAFEAYKLKVYGGFDMRYLNKIKKVIFSGNCTIVLWKDGKKTMARCQDGDQFNEEIGLYICIAKYVHQSSPTQFHKKVKKLLADATRQIKEGGKEDKDADN